MKILSAVLMTVITVTLFGCGGSEESSTSNEDTSSRSEEVLISEDPSESNESSASKEVTIGKQVWMTENLNVDKFHNGDPIPHAKTDEEWIKAFENGEPAWCYYDNDPANGEKYGKLYNWYAVNDPRGLAPKGWHIPNDEEWTTLTNHLGENAGTKMKSTGGWNEGGNGTNESGFSGLPGGSISQLGRFFNIGEIGFLWSSTESGKYSARYLSITFIVGGAYTDFYGTGRGMSVRCLRD